jgi:hypothetical protein
MATSVVDHVLSVEEVRKRMKDVNEAALHQGAVIHYGERGADQLVIMSRELCESLLADRPRAAAARPGPYAAFNRALAEGRLGGQERAAAVQVPRRMPGLSDESGLSLEQMVAAGSDDRVPSRRRRAAAR